MTADTHWSPITFVPTAPPTSERWPPRFARFSKALCASRTRKNFHQVPYLDRFLNTCQQRLGGPDEILNTADID